MSASIAVQVQTSPIPVRLSHNATFFFLRVAEGPNLVALEALAWEIAERPALVLGARPSNVREQSEDGPLGRSRHSHGRAD